LSKVTGEAAKVVGDDKPKGLTAAIMAAGTAAQKAHLEDARDKAVALQAEVFSKAAAYDNGVILAGYVAFFALWAGSNKDVSHLCRLVTVALMGTSLLCYMAWHILQMLTRQTYEFKLANVMKLVGDAKRFNEEWAKTLIEEQRALVRIMRFWPFLFVPAVGLGFLAGGILTYNSLAVIFGWPQLAN
jgi:hypothetical protein